MAIEPDMGDPDWDRYIMHGRGGQPVGNPTTWGGRASTMLEYTSGPLRSFASAEFAAAQTADGYSRSWAIVGNLMMPAALIGSDNAIALLQCTMGVGQVTIQHNITLMGGAKGGLCNSQHFENAGPYWNNDEGRAFAAIGSLIGRSISIRMLYLVAVPIAAMATVSVIMTPFAAGEGL